MCAKHTVIAHLKPILLENNFNFELLMFLVNSASPENSTENNNRTVIITEFEVEENVFFASCTT